MNCQQCSAELLEGARFCSKCGATVTSPEPTAHATQQTEVSRAVEPPRPEVDAGQPRAEAVPELWQEARNVWARVGSLQLMAPGVLVALALLLGLVGLVRWRRH